MSCWTESKTSNKTWRFLKKETYRTFLLRFFAKCFFGDNFVEMREFSNLSLISNSPKQPILETFFKHSSSACMLIFFPWNKCHVYGWTFLSKFLSRTCFMFSVGAAGSEFVHSSSCISSSSGLSVLICTDCSVQGRVRTSLPIPFDLSPSSSCVDHFNSAARIQAQHICFVFRYKTLTGLHSCS